MLTETVMCYLFSRFKEIFKGNFCLSLFNFQGPAVLKCCAHRSARYILSPTTRAVNGEFTISSFYFSGLNRPRKTEDGPQRWGPPNTSEIKLFQSRFLAAVHEIGLLGKLLVEDLAADGEEQADNTGDVVPRVCSPGEIIRSDGKPHIAPRVERYKGNTDKADVENTGVAGTVASLLHGETGNDGDENLGERPEFPHGRILQLETKVVEGYVEDEDEDLDSPTFNPINADMKEEASDEFGDGTLTGDEDAPQDDVMEDLNKDEE